MSSSRSWGPRRPWFDDNDGEIAEAFNLTNRRNDVIRNTNFGAGAYPTSPSTTFNQITAVADPRSVQFAVRVGF